ncbi:hypothetical protein [Sutcliffiella horikoshii]|uniref:hypothetical protein n=1 Tax=Sutcliffiella horikoshii TaxID=79883 RepID=UPI00165366CA|nr:hypothetical protein [Sutcliffiella horikoshii]
MNKRLINCGGGMDCREFYVYTNVRLIAVGACGATDWGLKQTFDGWFNSIGSQLIIF